MNTKLYGLQNETRQYLRRLYSYGRELVGLDITDIDDFIKGLKQLGLWGNTIFWLMRTQHNIGNGSRILGFGGYNSRSLDASIINAGISWSSDGMLLIDGSSYINFGSGPLLHPSITDLFICVKSNIVGDNQKPWTNVGATTANYFQFNLNNSTTQSAYFYETRGGTTYSPTAMQLGSRGRMMNFCSASLGFNFHQQNLNGVAQAATTSLNIYNPIGYANMMASYAGGFRGNIPFIMMMNNNNSIVSHINVYNLYKNTIGKGLLLP